MLTIEKKYVVDEHQNPFAVQLDLATYRRIEETLENFALVQLIKEGDDDEILNEQEAKQYYDTLDKTS